MWSWSAFWNRVYDSYLAWYENHYRERAVCSIKISDRVKELRAHRAEVSWRWEPIPEFKRRVGRMTAKKFRQMKDDYPDFVTRVGEAFRDTPYGVKPENTSGYPPMEHGGGLVYDLAKDLKEFRENEPKHEYVPSQWEPNLEQLRAWEPRLPHADNTLVPGTEKTFAEMGLPIDSNLVVEPVPPAKESEPDIREHNDVVDRLLTDLIRNRVDDPDELIRLLAEETRNG